MDEKIKPLLAAFCGALTALAENYGTICSICGALILLDQDFCELRLDSPDLML